MRSAADEPHQNGPVPFASPARVGPSNRQRGSARRYARIARWALGVDGVFVVVLAFDLHGPVRLLLGLVFALVIPGWSVVGHFRLENPALELGLSVVASLSILIVAAQILLATHWWHLWAFDLLAAILCAPSLAWQGGVIAPIRSSRTH